MKPVHYFTKEQLARSRKLTPTQLARAAEEFRLLYGSQQRSKLISLRVPERLLEKFRQKAAREGIKYQVKLKQLMGEYVASV